MATKKADRSEKLTITRSHTGTFVKLLITEDGITVNYTVKSYESHVAGSIKDARLGAEKLLSTAKAANHG